MSEEKIRTPWGEIAAKCWNSPLSKPVLAIHGLQDNAGSFDRLIPLLPRDRFYVAVDLPGHGFSTRFTEGLPLDFTSYVLQLKRVVLHFKWVTVTLMGHSFGAHIAVFYASIFTDEVEKLILLEGLSPTPMVKDVYVLSHFNEMTEILKGERKEKRKLSYDEALSLTMNGRWIKLNRKAAEVLLVRSLRQVPGGYVFGTDPRSRWEIKPTMDEEALLCVFARIRCPVLVVLGRESEHGCLRDSVEFYKKVRRVLENSHPDSKSVTVEGNHCLHINQPDKAAPVLRSFLLHSNL